MIQKPIEYWAALFAAVGFVFMRNRAPGAIYGGVVAGVSGMLSIALSADVAAWLGWPENVVLVLIAAFGWALMDTAIALVADRELIKRLISKKVGGDDES